MMALNKKVLIIRDEVPAKINYRGKSYNASIKLKGNLSTHWETARQWSLKVNLKSGYTILGMKEFSLTKHSERSYPSNPIISDFLSEINISTPSFQTFLVKFNGESWGIMLAEEQISSVYMEKRKLKDSLIIKPQTQDRTLSKQINFYNKNIDFNAHQKINYLLDKRMRLYNQNKYFKKSQNSNFSYNKHLGNITKSISKNVDIENYIDLQKVVDVFTVSLVWHEYHSMHSHQQRYYYNPFSAKLEIIPTDFGHGTDKDSLNYFENYEIFYNHIIDNQILKKTILHNKFYKLFQNSLTKIDKNFHFFGERLEQYCKYFTSHCRDKVKLDTYKNHLKFLIDNSFEVSSHLKSKLKLQKDIDFKNALKEINKDKLYKFINSNNSFLDVLNQKNETLEIKNLSPFQISIDDITIKHNNDTYKITDRYNIESSKFNKINSLKIRFEEFKNLNDIALISTNSGSVVEIKYKLNNILKKEVKNLFPIYYLKEINKSNLEFINIKKNIYEVKSGSWKVKSPIIVPKNYDLIISKNTKLKFEENSFIYLNGGSLIIDGDVNNEVVLSAENKYWRGIYVNNANNTNNLSKITYAIIEDTTYFENQNMSLTGGINFYKSNIEIQNLIFNNNMCEDALNITHSKLDIKNSKFLNTQSDAFDADFSNVKMENIHFENIIGDAIDTSGSKIEIYNITSNNVSDKSLSIGEKSVLQGSEIKIFNSKIGLASKDSSIVKLKNISIKNSKVADLISYRKKHLYGYGEILINNADININKVFSEKPNYIKLENLKINQSHVSRLIENKKPKYPYNYDIKIEKLLDKRL